MTGSSSSINSLVAKQILKRMDKDGDGQISKPEFLNMFRMFESNSGGLLNKGMNQQQQSFGNQGMNGFNQQPYGNQGMGGFNQQPYGNQGGQGGYNQGGYNQGGYNQGGYNQGYGNQGGW